MNGLKLISIALVFALPCKGLHAEGPVHPQGNHPLGESIDENFFRPPANHPPKEHDTILGMVGGVNATLTITDDCTKVAGAPSGIPAYRCRARADLPICNRKAGKTPGYLVLVRGVWNTKSFRYVDLDDRFTASCSVDHVDDYDEWKKHWTGSLAKCVELWHMNTDGSKLTACIHMARAAYTGGADSFTCPGTRVDAWDVVALGPHQHDPGCTMVQTIPKYSGKRGALCAMWFEAEWDENGAICINHLRYSGLTRDAQNYFTQTFPPAPTAFDFAEGRVIHCRADVKDASQDAPLNTSPVVSNRNALIINRSDMNLFEFLASASTSSLTQPNCKLKLGIAPQPRAPRNNWDRPECLSLCPDPH